MKVNSHVAQVMYKISAELFQESRHIRAAAGGRIPWGGLGSPGGCTRELGAACRAAYMSRESLGPPLRGRPRLCETYSIWDPGGTAGPSLLLPVRSLISGPLTSLQNGCSCGCQIRRLKTERRSPRSLLFPLGPGAEMTWWLRQKIGETNNC